ASQILEAVVTAFGIPRFACELEGNSQNDIDPTPLPMLNGVVETRRPTIGPPAPSLLWAPEAFIPGLSAVQSILLIQALMLRRAPGIARTAAFQKELSQWQSAGTIPASADHSTSEVHPASRNVREQKPHLFEGKERSS